MTGSLRPDDRVLQALRLLFEQLQSNYGLSEDEILSQVKGAPLVTVPVSLFADKRARPLELLCIYLKGERNLSFKEIAALLNRDYRTVWTTCSNASRKLKGKLTIAASKYNLPVAIFGNRRLSVLEAVVAHMKEQFSLKFVEIASLIGRDQRNISAIYRRAKKKWETS